MLGRFYKSTMFSGGVSGLGECGYIFVMMQHLRNASVDNSDVPAGQDAVICLDTLGADLVYNLIVSEIIPFSQILQKYNEKRSKKHHFRET